MYEKNKKQSLVSSTKGAIQSRNYIPDFSNTRKSSLRQNGSTYTTTKSETSSSKGKNTLRTRRQKEKDYSCSREQANKWSKDVKDTQFEIRKMIQVVQNAPSESSDDVDDIDLSLPDNDEHGDKNMQEKVVALHEDSSPQIDRQAGIKNKNHKIQMNDLVTHNSHDNRISKCITPEKTNFSCLQSQLNHENKASFSPKDHPAIREKANGTELHQKVNMLRKESLSLQKIIESRTEKMLELKIASLKVKANARSSQINRVKILLLQAMEVIQTCHDEVSTVLDSKTLICIIRNLKNFFV